MSVAAIGGYCCCWDCIVIVGPSMISNLYSRRVHGSVSNSRTALRNVLDIEHEAVQKKKIHTVVVCVYRYVILSCWHSFFFVGYIQLLGLYKHHSLLSVPSCRSVV